MHGLITLAKINRQAHEAHLIMKAHTLQAKPATPAPQIEPAAERLATMNKLLDGAKG